MRACTIYHGTLLINWFLEVKYYFMPDDDVNCPRILLPGESHWFYSKKCPGTQRTILTGLWGGDSFRG